MTEIKTPNAAAGRHRLRRWTADLPAAGSAIVPLIERLIEIKPTLKRTMVLLSCGALLGAALPPAEAKAVTPRARSAASPFGSYTSGGTYNVYASPLTQAQYIGATYSGTEFGAYPGGWCDDSSTSISINLNEFIICLKISSYSGLKL